MTPNVAVIGAGPAGLLAAHGLMTHGCEVAIYAPETREKFQGAQVLHRAIPNVTGVFADAMVHIAKWGREFVYRTKVYGSIELDGPTSWDEYGDMLPVWNMNDVYRDLLAKYRHHIIDRRVAPAHIPMIGREFDAVINTAPATQFCEFPGLHVFPAAFVQITEGAQDGVQHNQIVYNGTHSERWYRSSRLFGYGSTEWPGPDQFRIDGAPVIGKPLWTDCDCHMGPKYYRAGRYGKWQKGVLAHDGYEMGIEVANALLAVQ